MASKDLIQKDLENLLKSLKPTERVSVLIKCDNLTSLGEYLSRNKIPYQTFEHITSIVCHNITVKKVYEIVQQKGIKSIGGGD